MTDYSELVKALRHVGIHQDCNECEAGRWHNEFDCCLFKDAAAAIEALQAEVDTLKLTDIKRCQECLYLGQPVDEQLLPKRGEWIYKPKDAIEMMFTLPKCSVCGHESSDALNYCPNCGSLMRGEANERG